MNRQILFPGLLALCSVLRCVALDGIVVVNEAVPATQLTAAALKDILTGKTMYWDGGAAINIVTAGEKADAALEQASGMTASAFKTHWQRLAFSGRGQPPKKADDPAKAIALVASTKGAVAILPAGSETKGAKALTVQ
jgi:ABC-type phosphate transport system substrate-binding protein